MGIQIDLIIPPVIVGLLVLVVFQLNAFIMETSIDNQLSNDMQTFAEVTSRIIQEEVKSAEEIERPFSASMSDSVLVFVSVTGDSITVQRNDKNLEIIRKSSITPSVPDTTIYPSSISSLEFQLDRKPATETVPYYLNVRIETESEPDQHATVQGEAMPVRAFSENEIYLRNVHRNSL